MTLRSIFAACALAALSLEFHALPAAAERSFVQPVVDDQSVTTAGGAVIATLSHPGHSRGYLVVTTTDEVNAASLAVSMATATGNQAVCTLSAITTETTTMALIGSEVAAGGGVADVCDFPLAWVTSIAFVVTGTDAEFTVDASMVWLPE
jgi:hypothetical protein